MRLRNRDWPRTPVGGTDSPAVMLTTTATLISSPRIFGLNTKYHASADKPALLYYGDFEESGRNRLIEAEFEDEVLYPVRGKSCSTHAMPFLANKFTTYKDFALADLTEIYSVKCLDDAQRFVTTTLESSMFVNDGGQFTIRPLPRLAQASPAFGVCMIDADADGRLDVYLVQNFYGSQPETGHMDGGLSLLLKGQGDGTFTSVWPSESGLVVAGDATGLSVVDLNDDSWPDFAAASNQGPLQGFTRNPDDLSANRPSGSAVDRRPRQSPQLSELVSLCIWDDGRRLTREVKAGGSYLSQSHIHGVLCATGCGSM